jgi:exopolyphosphatase / guanosine-5'-triphosphate,3'-diphosphate pyrophosphatase
MDINRASQNLIMRIASIDIGTNTILMLIADVKSDGTLSVLTDEHHIARLGQGVDEHGVIQQETFERVRTILSQLKEIANAYHVQRLVACSTSALRDAANRREFIEFIKNNLSFEITVLSGQEEARLTYWGTVAEYLNASATAEYAVLDIGGGSTELVVGTGSNIVSAVSADIGSVRITERILRTNPPEYSALIDAEHFIANHITNIPPLAAKTKLFGVAGTLTTVAALDLRLPEFNRTLIHGHILTVSAIENIFQELRCLTLDQIKAYPQIHSARADIIIAGILILLALLKKTNTPQIIVSERGLRYGIALQSVFTNMDQESR